MLLTYIMDINVTFCFISASIDQAMEYLKKGENTDQAIEMALDFGRKQ